MKKLISLLLLTQFIVGQNLHAAQQPVTKHMERNMAFVFIATGLGLSLISATSGIAAYKMLKANSQLINGVGFCMAAGSVLSGISGLYLTVEGFLWD